MPECTCEPTWQDAGGGYTELLAEPDPDCPEHFPEDPRARDWEYAPGDSPFERWEAVGKQRVIGPEDWPTEAELRADLTRPKTGRIV